MMVYEKRESAVWLKSECDRRRRYEEKKEIVE